MTHTVYLSLGSNVGDRLANLKAALAAMQPQVQLVAESPIYETEPWGYTEQDDFLNQVAEIKTELSPPDLLAHLKQIEAQIGRQATFRYGPREIDIDILLYDDLVYESPKLTIPHPNLEERAFVLVPLADLAPDLRHPTLNRTVSELLSYVGRGGVRPYQNE